MSLFTVFLRSGFTRNVCGVDWKKFETVYESGGDVESISGARVGCCPSGSFMSHPFVAPFSIEHSCSICPNLFSSSFTDVENDEISCNGKCPKGMYSDGSNGCEDCTAGKFNNIEGSTDNSSCKLCDLGMYSINSGSEACENCLGGKTTDAEGSSTTKECIDCDAGKHSTGKDNFTTCKDCPKDSYSEAGEPVCLKCDPGQYMPDVDPRPSGSCLDCTLGQFSNYGKVECTECKRGQYAIKEIADTGATSCISCPTGQYGQDAAVELRVDKDGACDECGVGKYSLAEGAKLETSCIDCQPGKKAKDVLAATEETEACTDCLVGQYRSSTDTDLTKCIDCPVGKTLGVPSGSRCIDCIPGHFSGVVGSHSRDCGKCPIGYSTEEGAGTDTSPTKDKCVACLLGTYADTEGLTKCSACAAGTYSDVHVTQSIEGKDFCKSCIVGQYRPSQIKVNNIMTKTELTKCK